MKPSDFSIFRSVSRLVEFQLQYITPGLSLDQRRGYRFGAFETLRIKPGGFTCVVKMRPHIFQIGTSLGKRFPGVISSLHFLSELLQA